MRTDGRTDAWARAQVTMQHRLVPRHRAAASESLTCQRAMLALKKRAPQTRSVDADLTKHPRRRNNQSQQGSRWGPHWHTTLCATPTHAGKHGTRARSHMHMHTHNDIRTNTCAHSNRGGSPGTCAKIQTHPEMGPPRVEETVHPRDKGCVPFLDRPMRRLGACGVSHVPPKNKQGLGDVFVFHGIYTSPQTR